MIENDQRLDEELDKDFDKILEKSEFSFWVDEHTKRPFNDFVYFCFKQPYYRVKRILEYSYHVLWNDRDWDHVYILELLKYKLERTRREIENGWGHTTEWKAPRVTEINEVLEALNSVLAGNFCEKEYNEIDEKYGPVKIESIKQENSKWFKMNIYREKCKNNEELDKEAHNKVAEIYKLEEEKTQEAYNKVFSLLAKYIRNWWD